MKVCPNCGYQDNPYWRHSRFDFNADYMSWEDFKREFPDFHFALAERANNNPVELQGYFYYRRGTGGLEVYRVAKEDYKMPRERKNHKITVVDEQTEVKK
jgi:hypothetical protein